MFVHVCISLTSIIVITLSKLFIFIYYSDYLCNEHMDKKGEPLDPSIYVTETMKVFIDIYAELISLIIFCNNGI